MRRIWRRGRGKEDDELAAASHTVAARRHCPAVQLDEPMHDRQAEAEPAVAPSRGRLALAERLEDMRQEIGIDPLPGVADDQANTAAVARHRDVDAAAPPDPTTTTAARGAM